MPKSHGTTCSPRDKWVHMQDLRRCRRPLRQCVASRRHSPKLQGASQKANPATRVAHPASSLSNADTFDGGLFPAATRKVCARAVRP